MQETHQNFSTVLWVPVSRSICGLLGPLSEGEAVDLTVKTLLEVVESGAKNIQVTMFAAND